MCGPPFEGHGPLQLAVGVPSVAWATRASVTMSALRIDTVTGAVAPPPGVPARDLVRRGGVTWMKGVYACDITRIAAAGTRRTLPARWRPALARLGTPGSCRTRRMAADAGAWVADGAGRTIRWYRVR